uniref:Serine/threonine-protein kinase RIO2 n=1 Tax=Parascaris univalens TaxID=6257 RepID=A0A915AFG1_PARUN
MFLLGMGRMDVALMRHLRGEHFRVLTSVEMGMKNHELVPLQLIASIAGIHRGAVARILSDLQKNSLVLYERGKRYDGYRITNLGYDFLALKALCSRGIIGYVGNQIGVGKESDVFIGGDPDLNDVVLKFHRLGLISFRKLKEKRDYHNRRKSCSWIYLARLAATKEFAFLKALHDRNFPVPRPIDVCRHLLVMSFIDGHTFCNVKAVDNVDELYEKLMCLIVRLAKYGLIHGDFNEFNLMLNSKGEAIIIDFPQMVSVDHPNAAFYFQRDVDCVRTFFKRRFEYESELYPKFEDVKRKYNLDVEVAASGFTKQMAKDLNAAFEAGDFGAHLEEERGDETESDEEQEEETSESDDDYEEQREQECLIEKAKNSDRFADWLKDAREHLQRIAIEEGLEDENCPQLLCTEDYCAPSNDVSSGEIIKPPAKSVNEKNEKMQCDEDSREYEKDDGSDVKEYADSKIEGMSLSRGKVTQPRSLYSTGSTFAPQDIKRRLALEQRAKQKVKLRIKGKASAVRRGRKTNMNVIKEYAGWDL